MPIKHIIFDFDGTIANTIEKGRIILNSLAAEYKFRQVEAEEIPALRELTLPALLKNLGIGKLQVPSLLARGSRDLKALISEIPLIPGIREIIPTVHQHAESCGILTSNTQENVTLFLEKNNLSQYFSYISSTSKLTGKSKHLRSICRTFSCLPSEVLYIGDEVRDVKACIKSAVPVAAVTWGFNAESLLRESQPTYLIHTPHELCELIKTLTAH